ncbi:MAG: hypothetical protein NW703_13145 [Nitrospiraceae bacterium]
MTLSLLASLPMEGCSSLLQESRNVQIENQGTVEFEEIVDWSFEASHPIVIDRDTIVRILRGIHVGTGQGSQAFTDKEVEFLSPSISAALAKARPEQVVVFQVVSRPDNAAAATGGTIYVKGQSVYLTLTQFRSKPIHTGFWSWATSKPVPPQELIAGTLTFRPESTVRIQRAASDVAMNYTNLSTLVIDYLVLSRLTDHELPPAAEKMQTITANAVDSSSQPPISLQIDPTVLVPAQAPADSQEGSIQSSQDRPTFVPALPTPPSTPASTAAKTQTGGQPARKDQARQSKPVKSKKSSKPSSKASVEKAPRADTR